MCVYLTPSACESDYFLQKMTAAATALPAGANPGGAHHQQQGRPGQGAAAIGNSSTLLAAFDTQHDEMIVCTVGGYV